jgi:hypothetical protein
VLEANPELARRALSRAGRRGRQADRRGPVGRKLPLVPRVEITMVEEAQPRLLSFERGEIDMIDLPATSRPTCSTATC